MTALQLPVGMRHFRTDLNIHFAAGRSPPKRSAFWRKYRERRRLCPAGLRPHFPSDVRCSPAPPRQLTTRRRPQHSKQGSHQNQRTVLTVQKMLLKPEGTNHAADQRRPGRCTETRGIKAEQLYSMVAVLWSSLNRNSTF